jgi:hypothetical protein
MGYLTGNRLGSRRRGWLAVAVFLTALGVALPAHPAEHAAARTAAFHRS